MDLAQNYISDELTHFVGRDKKSDEERYGLLCEILRSGQLGLAKDRITISEYLHKKPGGRICMDELFNPEMVCFCDIPLKDLEIHVRKYSGFGISFSKDFIFWRNGRPVFYIPTDTAIEGFFNGMYSEYEKLMANLEKLISGNPDPNLLDLRKQLYQVYRDLDCHIFSYVKCFDARLPNDHEENYYFEREWRVLGGIKFVLQDVARILLPSQEYVERFRTDFGNYQGKIENLDAPTTQP